MTSEQIEVKPVYSSDDLAGMEHLQYAAGVAPFLRGPYSTMYVMKPWTSASMQVSQLPKNPMPSTAGISQPDRWASPWLSTWLHHRDTTAITNASWVMSAKPALPSTPILDMKILFDQIPLDKMSVSMTMNGAVLNR
jgi:methylmalonyl-CoA mutase